MAIYTFRKSGRPDQDLFDEGYRVSLVFAIGDWCLIKYVKPEKSDE